VSRRSRLTAEERLKLRPQTHSASNLDHTRFKVREIGKFLPRDLQAKREATVEKLSDDRQELRRLALVEATLTARRDVIARKLYRGEGVSLEDWPASQKLTPQERTIILRDLRQILGCPERSNRWEL